MFQGPIHTPEGLIPSLTFPLPSSSPFQDVFARFKAKHGTKWDLLPEKAVFQMNDTHPTIAVAEVMRLLVDIEGLAWEHAWTITTKVWGGRRGLLGAQTLSRRSPVCGYHGASA